GLAARLVAGRFGSRVLLPNACKSALICDRVGIERVVGYERDGLRFLLTDKLVPMKDKGKFLPTPAVRAYMGIAHYLGSQHRNQKLELFVTDLEKREAIEVLGRCGLESDIDRPASHGAAPLVILNPGAQYGAAKCWLPE